MGTTTEIYDYLRLLYARAGVAYSYLSGEEMVKYTEEQILELILKDYKGKKIYLLARWFVHVKDIIGNCSSRCEKKDIYMSG
ncbi:hypothetical protein BFINE_32640 [Bacteroides finegoldii DSM 17565]|nr:hypothetical protein BFINE_32640 [Bacteroides finegoldii DSM 17565]